MGTTLDLGNAIDPYPGDVQPDGRTRRVVIAGAVLAAAMAFASAAGWWDGDGATTPPSGPDVVSIPGTSAGSPGEAPSGNDGYVNPWETGNEAVRRLVDPPMTATSEPG